MEKLSAFLSRLDELIWGPWLIALILGTGLYLLIRMDFLPFRNFFYALKCTIRPEPGRERPNQSGHSSRASDQTSASAISPLSSLTTELAATIGTGNIVGVATAMILGGPGALVWMLLSSLISLSTKFAESMLSVKYRTVNDKNQPVGGPMYTLSRAFPHKKAGRILAVLFAVFAVFASLGMGNMTQSNSIACALEESFGLSRGKTGLILSLLVILAVLGGIKAISGITLWLVPAMALLYIIGSLIVILANPGNLGEGISQIFSMAFSKKALAGGFGGGIVVTLRDSLRYGVSRGVFSNEAGLGAGGITAAAAKTDNPVRQGYISMTGVFFDTILICLLTGLVLACSGVLGMRDETGALLTGSALAVAAFSTVYGNLGGSFVAVGISLFAFATIIAWEYQGEKAFEYLAGSSRHCIWYRFLYTLVTFTGAVCALETIWNFSDIMNGLMAVPNLICILALSKTVCREMKEYERI